MAVIETNTSKQCNHMVRIQNSEYEVKCVKAVLSKVKRIIKGKLLLKSQWEIISQHKFVLKEHEAPEQGQDHWNVLVIFSIFLVKSAIAITTVRKTTRLIFNIFF